MEVPDKPEIIIVSPRFPFPTVKGDQVISFYRLKMLSRHYAIHFISIDDGNVEPKDIEKLKEYCVDIILISKSRLKSYLDVLLALFRPSIPMQVAYFQSQKTFRAIREICSRREVYYVHLITLRTIYQRDLKKLPVPAVVDFIDSMKLNLLNSIKLMGKGFKKLLYRSEVKRVSSLEERIPDIIEYGLVVSKRDKEHINKENIYVVPNGVDLEKFKPGTDIQKESKRIIFTGNMNYEPNKQAYLWFIQYVWPKIVNHGISFVVAGKGSQKLPKPESSGNIINLLGYVDSINDELNRSAVSIAPMRSGSGIQNKILEAMAAGLPVVTTPFGAGGIEAEEKHGLFTTDDPNTFAKLIIDLCHNSNNAMTAGSSARKFMEENYTWKKTGDQILELNHRYFQAVSSSASSSR